MGTLSVPPRCSLENDQIALLFDFVCVYTINLSTGECFPFSPPSPPVSVLYDSKSVLHFVQPISSPSPSYGSLLSEDFLKLSIPSARTHFTCFPYLDSILLIGGYFPLPSPLISPASPAPAKTSSTSGSSFPPSSNGRFSAKTAGKPCSPAPPTRSTATASSASAAPSRGSPSSSSTALSGRPSPWYPRGSRLTARKARRRSFRTPSPWKPSTPTPRSSPSGVPRFHRPSPRRPSSAPSPATPPNWRAASASPRACFPVSPF